MRRQRVDQVEKRRTLVELNLIGDGKNRSAAANRGCASLITRLLGGAVFLLLLRLGLG
jgi:hypothetical protein